MLIKEFFPTTTISLKSPQVAAKNVVLLDLIAVSLAIKLNLFFPRETLCFLLGIPLFDALVLSTRLLGFVGVSRVDGLASFLLFVQKLLALTGNPLDKIGSTLTGKLFESSVYHDGGSTGSSIRCCSRRRCQKCRCRLMTNYYAQRRQEEV